MAAVALVTSLAIAGPADAAGKRARPKKAPKAAPAVVQDPAALHKKARAKMKSLDFEAALPLLDKALSGPGLGSSARSAVLVDKGITLVNLGRQDEARLSFEDALGLDAAVQLPPSSSPKIRSIFESARQAKLPPAPPPVAEPTSPVPPPPAVSPLFAVLPERQPASTAALRAAPPEPGRSLTAPIVFATVSAVSLTAAIVTASMSRSVAADLRGQLRDGADAQALQDRRQTLSTVSIAGYAVAGAAAATGALWFLLAGDDAPAQAALVPGGAIATFSARF